MIDNIDSSSSTLRLLVARALKQLRNDGLIKLLTEDDIIVRTAAARELHLRVDREIFENVKKLKIDERAFVREITAFTLGQLGTPEYPFKNESIPILMDLAKDPDPDVRAATAAGFGHLCFDSMPFDVETELLNATKDESVDVRSCAAYALGNSSGSEKVINVLKKLLSDKSNTVGSYAELGLELIKEK